jgi:HNH endonuclease
MAVSKRLRYEILLRDNHTCRYCGATATEAPMTVDHVIPKALGGSDDPSNLVAACRDCNAGKSSSTATATQVADVAADALRWAAAMKQASELRAAEIAQDEEVCDDFECVWTSFWLKNPRANDTSTRYRHPGREYAPRDSKWETSILNFIKAGLDQQFFAKAVRLALYENQSIAWEDCWRYFCGICWRELDDRREIAKSLIAEQEASE